jgi:hypothetical protein
MKFSNFLYTTIIKNLGTIIMVGMGIYSFGISTKWIILIGAIGIYINYELTKRGIIKSESTKKNIPYANNIITLIKKITQFKPYNPDIVNKIISDIDHYFYIHNQIQNNKNLQYCNQYVEKLENKLKLINNNFNSLVHVIQNNDVLRNYHKTVIADINNELMPYFKRSFNKCINNLNENINSNVQLPQTNIDRVETANKYSLSGNNFNLF